MNEIIGKKVYLLIGLTGCGKSTIGNCLLNKSGDLGKIKNSPFKTSNSASGCTHCFQVHPNNESVVIDTIAFGDPDLKDDNVLEQFRECLNIVNYKIDYVLYIVKQGRLTIEQINLINFFQENILDKKLIDNSILIFNGSIKVNNQINTFIKNELEQSVARRYEFDLKFDDVQDDEIDRKKNILKRQNSIDLLIKFLNEQNFQKKDISHIQSTNFELKWSSSLSSQLFPNSKKTNSFISILKNHLIRFYFLRFSKKMFIFLPFIAISYYFYNSKK